MITSTLLSLENTIKRQAQGRWSTSTEIIMDEVDLGAVGPKEDKTLTYLLTIPELPVTTTDKEDPDIVNSYSLNVKVVPDVISFKTKGASIPITIGNIPHKVAFQTFQSDGDDMNKLPAEWTKKYSNIPDHTGDKYISYKSK